MQDNIIINRKTKNEIEKEERERQNRNQKKKKLPRDALYSVMITQRFFRRNIRSIHRYLFRRIFALIT